MVITKTALWFKDRHTLAIALAIMVLLAGILDAVSTELALATGQAMEANPIVRSFQSQIGVFWVVPKMLVHALLAWIVVYNKTNFTFIIVGLLSVVTLGVSVSNFEIYFDILGRVLH